MQWREFLSLFDVLRFQASKEYKAREVNVVQQQAMYNVMDKWYSIYLWWAPGLIFSLIMFSRSYFLFILIFFSFCIIMFAIL